MSLSQDKELLAVVRENHAIELWKTDSFAQILTIPGHKNVDIRTIHWLENEFVKGKEKDSNILYYPRSKNGKLMQKKRRIVTTGLNGMVMEWDIQNKA